jgi:hypothetical protein
MPRLFSSRPSRLAIGLAVGGAVVLLLAATVRMDPWGQTISMPFSSPVSLSSLPLSPDDDASAPSDAVARSLRTLDVHPARTLQPYFPPGAPTAGTASPSVLHSFHDLLDQFARRQAIDDNFTVRVIDNRSHETLELYELASLRQQFQRSDSADWEKIDDRRRDATERLVDKYEARGVPIEDIIVRWGRANQIDRAHKRGAPYATYEIQLARSLGLSLLATEIGTVETFNQDDLVSGAGARSRYQMMPWILHKSGVHQYRLYTKGGAPISVKEELHPLLALRPAFLLLRGYVNAVGHEIPGLSAYHTGPGNIFKLYRHYYTKSEHFSAASTVADAYIWAITDGFSTVRENSSFGPYSRGYVPSLYGALRANDRGLPDSSETMRAARVQLRPSTSVTLDVLLTTLDSTDRSMRWGPVADEPTTYHRFRALNPHLDLPAEASPSGGVPADGNVRLVSSIEGKAVHVFLPLQAPDALRAAGLDVIDPSTTKRFDDTTYRPPSDDQKTRWDRQYAALVDDIAEFGFTPHNRDRLLTLHDKFAALAEETPSAYRQRQLDVIQTHRRLWLSGPWEDLSDLTMRVTGRVPAQPPVDLAPLDLSPTQYQPTLPESEQ